MQVQAEVQERYQAALAQLTTRLEEDYYVLAAILYGSLARGEPWERSDIDLFIILRDGQERETRHAWIVEDDINISADVMTRSQCRRALEGTLQGTMLHSIRSQFKLLFSKDESITAWLQDSERVGAHDRQMAMLRTGAEVFWTLDKAEKWFYVKRDLNYALVWILYTVNTLAKLEVLLNGAVPAREALDQALKYNPAFFQCTYIDLINGPKTEETFAAALQKINAYLEEHTHEFFKPVLDYMAQANGLCTAAEMTAYFKKKIQMDYMDGVYEWLARKGVTQKLSSPMHLTRKSQVTLDEPAYYYDAVNLEDWE
jgi:predicted nucleotidyltransferase